MVLVCIGGVSHFVPAKYVCVGQTMRAVTHIYVIEESVFRQVH